MNYLELKLWKCSNSTSASNFGKSITCFDKNTIDAYFSKETFSFAFINMMFALDNYDSPLQPFIDD